MKKVEQTISGSHNIQVSGDYITTQKVVRQVEVLHDPNLHITDEQAHHIKELVLDLAKDNPKISYQGAYSLLYKRFKITKYSLLPREKYEEATKFLQKQIAIYRPALRKTNNEKYRNDMYKSIHARSRQLNIDIHEYATTVLETKTPVKSLKELSDTRLKKLYTKLFSQR